MLMPDDNEVSSSAIVALAKGGANVVEKLEKFFDPYGDTERREYCAIREAYQSNIGDSGLQIPRWFISEEPQCPPESSAPRRESYKFAFWQSRLKSGYFEACSRSVVSRICEYETKRLRSDVRDPTHLFFNALKEFFVKLSEKKIPKDAAESDYKMLEVYLEIINDLDIKNVFEPSKLPLRSGEKTRNATLIECKRIINLTLDEVKASFKNTSAREQLEKLLECNKSLVINLFDFLVFSLCPFELPEYLNINFLRDPRKGKLKFFFKGEEQSIGVRLQKLSLSQPIIQLIPQESETRQKDSSTRITAFSLSNNLQAYSELTQCLASNKSSEKKEKLYSVYRHLQKKEEILKGFFQLYFLLYQYAELSQLFSLLYRLSGSGGDLTVCGITRETSQLLFYEQRRLCELIDQTLKSFYGALNNVYEEIKTKRKSKSNWVKQQITRQNYKNKIDIIISDILRVNSNLSDKMSISPEEMIRDAVGVISELNFKAVQYVKTYQPPKASVLLGKVVFSSSLIDQQKPLNRLVERKNFPLISEPINHSDSTVMELNSSQIPATRHILSLFSPRSSSTESLAITTLSSSSDAASVSSSCSVEVPASQIQLCYGVMNSIIPNYRYDKNQWVVSVHRMSGQVSKNQETAIILVEGVRDNQEFIRKFVVTAQHVGHAGTAFFFWACNKARIFSVLVETHTQHIESPESKANHVIPLYAEKLIAFMEKVQRISAGCQNMQESHGVGVSFGVESVQAEDRKLIEYEASSYQSISSDEPKKLECYKWCLEKATDCCGVSFSQASHLQSAIFLKH